MITSVRAPNGRELMAAGHPAPAMDPHDFPTSGLTGWHDCFPTIAAGEVLDVGGRRVAVGDHGDLWHCSWTIEEQRPDSLRMSCRLPELGVRAERSVSWEGGSLVVESAYRLERPSGFPFVWASHPLFEVDEESWIDLGDQESRSWPRSPNGMRLGETWPAIGGRRYWRDVPMGTARKLFLAWPDGGVQFFTVGQLWRMDATFDGAAPTTARLGLWINRGGFPAGEPLSHLAIEPTLGDADTISAAAAGGTAQTLEFGRALRVRIILEPLMG